MGAPERLGNVSLTLRNVVHISTTRTWLAETRLGRTRTQESVRRAMYLRCRDNSRRFGQNAPPHRVLILGESRSPVAQGGRNASLPPANADSSVVVAADHRLRWAC